ncbi:MAG: insulinase family protein, partial [Acidobacteriota bacterium]|nr:insulinase family protein [Acidobacteriota bacterium]
MRKNLGMLILLVVGLLFGGTTLAQTTISPLNIKQRTLSNGLRVVSVQDNSSPTVAIHVWYNVGGKNDPNGRSGFAHMFEHMMFKSTKNMKNEMMDRLTEDVGGFNNASTAEDWTNYYEVVPSNYLETLLWAESDRMVNLNVDEANFSSERDVVKEEFRQSVLAQPYGRLYEFISSLSYQKHPY